MGGIGLLRLLVGGLLVGGLLVSGLLIFRLLGSFLGNSRAAAGAESGAGLLGCATVGTMHKDTSNN